jgi:hypothetical protein
VGIEEEFLLVDVATGRPQAVAGFVMRAATASAGGDGGEPGSLEFELHKQQVEINTTCACRKCRPRLWPAGLLSGPVPPEIQRHGRKIIPSLTGIRAAYWRGSMRSCPAGRANGARSTRLPAVVIH